MEYTYGHSSFPTFCRDNMEQAVTSLQATIKQQEAELAEFQVGYPINFRYPMAID